MPEISRQPVSPDELGELFQTYNQRYFNNELVPSEGFSLRFSRSTQLFGCFRYCLQTHVDWAIDISSRLADHPRALRSTLVHEMIHMLAHQKYRETGDAFYLDEHPVPGEPFVNADHGAYFLSQVERLNRQWPELHIAVTSHYGNHLYEHDRIPPRHLLVVALEDGRGMIYGLHPKAAVDISQLQRTAAQLHDPSGISVLKVRGELAEGFPVLRKDNRAPARMKPLSLRGFEEVAGSLRSHRETVTLYTDELVVDQMVANEVLVNQETMVAAA